MGAAWSDVAVGDENLERAMSNLQHTLGPREGNGPAYIQRLARGGYRFAVPVERASPRMSGQAVDALLEPHRAFVEGRATLEPLEHDAIRLARDAFLDVLRAVPGYAPGHVGLANALLLDYQSTRADREPDFEALRAATDHARDACRIDPASGEAWATLCLVLSHTRAGVEALSAGRRATALEPGDWRHHLRLAQAAWGEERLRASHRALELQPGLALAHWLAATVHVARQVFDEADRELTDGVAALEGEEAGSRRRAVGLHLLRGLVRLAHGDEVAATEEFERELEAAAGDRSGTREAAATSWCALGAVRLRQGDPTAARDAFARALAGVGGHPIALAAVAALDDDAESPSARGALEARLAELQRAGATVPAAIADAVNRALMGRHAEAAALVHAALRSAPLGSAGWTVPVEPLLRPGAHRVEWNPVLAALRNRAT